MIYPCLLSCSLRNTRATVQKYQFTYITSIMNNHDRPEGYLEQLRCCS